MRHQQRQWVAAFALFTACTAPVAPLVEARGPQQEAPAQAPQTPPPPPAGQAPAVPPTGTTPAAPAQASPPVPGTAAPLVARSFASPTGLIFNAVRPERVGDFERALGYFMAALEKSTDPGVRAQAEGWRVMKASEPGPNGAVVYVFLIDPTVAGADYSLGPILAEAYPNPAELQQIWKLYTSAVTSGGSLMSLTPVKVPPPTGPLTTPVPPAASPTAAPSPGAPPATTPPPAAPPATPPAERP